MSNDRTTHYGKGNVKFDEDYARSLFPTFYHPVGLVAEIVRQRLVSTPAVCSECWLNAGMHSDSCSKK